MHRDTVSTAGRLPRVRLVFLLALAAIMAACSQRPESTPSVDSAAPPESSRPASGDASAGDGGSPANWLMSEQGLGPLRAGLTPAQAALVVPGRFTVPDADLHEPCVYATWSEAPSGVRVMVDGGTVARVEVDEGRVATRAGVRIGDTEARVDSVYGARVRRLPHKYTDGRYLIVVAEAPADTMFRLVFETDGARVTQFRGGRFPQVEYVEGCS